MKNDFTVKRLDSNKYRVKIVFQYGHSVIVRSSKETLVRTTTCLLYLYNKHMPLPSVLKVATASKVGHAFCSPIDQFVKRIGRRVALKSALETVSRYERAQIWANYRAKTDSNG